MSTAKNVLVVGPSWIGDMVMTQSLFKLIKSRHPDSNIDVVAPPYSLAVLQRMGEVRQAFGLSVQHGRIHLNKRWQMARVLRRHQYDQAIVVPRSYKSAIVPFLAGIPQRTGWVGEARLLLLNDLRRLRPQYLPLMVQRIIALGLDKDEPLPCDFAYPSLQVSEEQLLQTQQQLSLDIPTGNILALCPGAEYGGAKRWPERHFAQLAKHYRQRGWRVWILGSPNDVPVAERIQSLCENICENFAGKTTLANAIDLLAMATAVISNDSGLMHIAASMNKPMVALFGSSAPNYTPPLSARAKILYLAKHCSPCFKRSCPYGHRACLDDITPLSVIAALTELTTSSISPYERITPFPRQVA